MERHSFRLVLGKSPKVMRKLCLSTIFPQQEIWRNYGIYALFICSVRKTNLGLAYIKDHNLDCACVFREIFAIMSALLGRTWFAHPCMVKLLWKNMFLRKNLFKAADPCVSNLHQSTFYLSDFLLACFDSMLNRMDC